MFGFFYKLLLVICVLACHSEAQNSGPGSSSGNARNGKGCVRVETAPFGNIVSPNYGIKYPPSSVCKWTIKAPLGTKIRLYFRDFLIEKSNSCKNDYLLLFDGPNESSRLVGRYCNTAPIDFTSSTNYIHLEFYSDISLEYRGFHATYTYNKSLSTTVKSPEWRSKPKFLNTVINRTVVEGEMVRLTCEVDATPQPVIWWTKNSQNLTKDNRVTVEERPLESVVRINKASTLDQGIYTCIAYNGVGSAISSHGWLFVNLRELPLIKKTTENKTVTVGSKLKLNCVAEGQPPMKIMWKAKDKGLANENCNQRSNCKVQLTKMFVQDTIITCEVVNKAGIASRNVHIKVKGPPLITNAPKDQKLQRGLIANFTCVAMGQAPLKISWTKNGEIVSDGVVNLEGRSILSFKVTRNATVMCTVEGSQGGIVIKEARLIVAETKTPARIALRFVVVPKALIVEHNAPARLSCQAKGYPEAQISWLQDGTDVTKAAVMSNGVSHLMLNSLVKTVTIVCIARNMFEKIRSTTNITVTSAQNSSSRDSNDFDNNLKLIIGAGGGVLLLTIIIIIFLVTSFHRRKRNKDVEREDNQTDTREGENLISNPLFNKTKEEVEVQTGIERLDFPREDIVHCEDIENGTNVQMFLGRAADLPFVSGDYNVTVKVLKDTEPSEEKKQNFDVEAALLANLVHPNVVRMMAVCVKMPPLCLVFESSEYGCLEEYLQDCDPNEFVKKGRKTALPRDSFTELANVDRLSIAKQVSSGMQYLTEKGYIHQELRARNCMVFKDLQVKVANLGLRWANPEQNFFVMEPSEKKHFPVRWLPPEVILYGEYSESTDIWSYGVLVWEVFSDGQLPYTGINDNDVVSYVRGHNVLPRPKSCPHHVYEVLKGCWEMVPLDRPNFSSLLETMTSLHAGVAV